MSRKLQIVLPDPVARQLAELAAGVGEPLATVARPDRAQTDVALASEGRQGHGAPGSNRAARARPAAPALARALRRRPETGAGRCGEPIVALHGRYPRHLQRRQRRLVERRVTHRDALRPRRVARTDRHSRTRPPRRARLPTPTRRLRRHAPPPRRQHHTRMEARRATRGVGGTLGRPRSLDHLDNGAFGFCSL